MSCIAAPSEHVKPQFVTLTQRVTVHQLYDSAFPAGAFRPGTGPAPLGTAKRTRFAPIRDIKGALVPYIYAGGTLQCAIFETVFHDVDFTAVSQSVDLADFASKAHGVITFARDLKLARLHGTGLARIKASRLELIESPARCYQDTALWAQALHQQFPDIDGLAWKSRRLDDQDCYLFFGDRVKAADLAASPVTGPLSIDAGLRQAVIEEGEAVDLTVF
jgi:hypothetical protein